MEDPDSRPWPLPVGHRYGPQHYDIRNHNGRSSLYESRMLQVWQHTYSRRIKRVDFPGGYWDGTTQQAVLDVQQRAGLPRTGLLDVETWAATWTVPKGIRELPTGPPKKPSKYRLQRKQRDYWRRMSAHDISYVNDGTQPRWFPGRPFGPGERGPHVEVLQQIVGVNPSGFYTQELARRVRGLRRLHGLPVSDICDIRLAVAVDPGPWE